MKLTETCIFKSIENGSDVIVNIFFCVLLMPLMILLGPARYWIEFCPLFVVIVSCFFYACYFVTKKINIPRLLIEKKYRKLALFMAALIVGNYLLTLYPLPKLDFVTPSMTEYQTRVRDYGIFLSLWLMFTIVMGFAVTTSFVRELYGQLLRNKKIEAQRDKAELAMFKAQISPHFMFNTLNSLYSLVLASSQKAEDAFIKFTELLKYTYVTIENENVAIKDEINYIQNYIDLQALRLNEHTRVDWICDVDDDNLSVPPMLMLTFVENAFKYGASPSRDCSITIRLSVCNGLLRFETVNSIMKRASEFRKTVPVGIENCRARLSGIFPGKHRLETSENDGVFSVLLELKLSDNRLSNEAHHHYEEHY